MKVDLPRRTFTVDEYHRMADSGLFEKERVELVEGEVIAMAPKGSGHTACVSRLIRVFADLARQDALLRVQDPLRVDDRTELEPDATVVRFREDFYAGGHPLPRDVLLVVEVAESSLAYDRDVKMGLYARAGVREAWLVDLERPAIIVHTDPTGQGYRSMSMRRPGELVGGSGWPSTALKVDELLG